jgi:ubiquitin-conjugating enzyme E2 D
LSSTTLKGLLFKMLRRRGTFEEHEATSTQDQSSLRRTPLEGTTLRDSASHRQIQLSDNHYTASLATYRAIEAGDARSLVTVSQYSATDSLGRPVSHLARAEQLTDAEDAPGFYSESPQTNEHPGHSVQQNRRLMNGLMLRADPPVPASRADITTPAPTRGTPVRLAEEEIEKICSEHAMSSHAIKRMMKEMRRMTNYGKSTSKWTVGVSVIDRLDDFVGFFDGPQSSPYEDGIFYVRFKIPDNYPFQPPICKMLTKVYHPNVDAGGRICVDILYDQYSPALECSSILVSLAVMLGNPVVADPLVPEIAEQFVRDRRRYDEIARDYTRKFATGELPETFDLDGKGQPWWTDARISRD